MVGEVLELDLLADSPIQDLGGPIRDWEDQIQDLEDQIQDLEYQIQDLEGRPLGPPILGLSPLVTDYLIVNLTGNVKEPLGDV